MSSSSVHVQPVAEPLAVDASPDDRLKMLLHGSPYQTYVYGYPHKTSYRVLEPPLALDALWGAERRDALFAYVHVPFCEMRCGFCNLFTSVKPGADIVEEYLEALARQCGVVGSALGARAFARLAIGGGTPTWLSAAQLHRLFDLLEQVVGLDVHATPASVECSPETATWERLEALRVRGVNRISMGVQSFVPEEVAAIHRPQDMDVVRAAIDRMQRLDFPTINLDLMYGLPGQDEASWHRSLEETVRLAPAEIFLYPLYVRPLTRMGGGRQAWDDQRVALYRQGRDFLQAQGYTQRSMRVFRRDDTAPWDAGPTYCMQEDGMVGLGCGARSYTSRTHWSSDYAVGPMRVKAIIQDYIRAPDSAFAHATYGHTMSDDDARRRYVLLALLQDTGLQRARYRAWCGDDVMTQLPELRTLIDHGLAAWHDDATVLRLTPLGDERADAVGPWLYSDAVRRLMHEHTTR